jgi:hypothetical protein
MYVVSQITPLEWRKASVCSPDDSEHAEHQSCRNSLNSLDGHEEFVSTDGGGNCSENYSTFERYLSNSNELSDEDVAWMSIEHRRNFLEHKRQQQPPGAGFEETLDIDDDGLIGFEPARQSAFSSPANDDHAGHNIELISYENNFNLYNSFWWAMGTLIQTTSDLHPKVSFPRSTFLTVEQDEDVDAYVEIAVLRSLYRSRLQL